MVGEFVASPHDAPLSTHTVRQALRSRVTMFDGPGSACETLGRSRAKAGLVRRGLLDLPTPAFDGRPRDAEPLGCYIDGQSSDALKALDRDTGSRSPETPPLRPGPL